MKRIAAILTSLVLVFSLAACGSQQAGTAAGSEAASTASSETASTAGSEAASAAQTKTEEQLLAEENDILTANDELWEKVFASMDKNVTQTTLNNNYGDFLMDAVDNAKDQSPRKSTPPSKRTLIRSGKSKIRSQPFLRMKLPARAQRRTAAPSHSLRARTLMATALTVACLPTMRSPL